MEKGKLRLVEAPPIVEIKDLKKYQNKKLGLSKLFICVLINITSENIDGSISVKNTKIKHKKL